MYLFTHLIIVVATILSPSGLQEILIGISVRYLTSIHSLAPMCKARIRINTLSSMTSGCRKKTIKGFPLGAVSRRHTRGYTWEIVSRSQVRERGIYKVGSVCRRGASDGHSMLLDYHRSVKQFS